MEDAQTAYENDGVSDWWSRGEMDRLLDPLTPAERQRLKELNEQSSQNQEQTLP